MKKIVINKCHGGFGLSAAAIDFIAKRRGLTLYPENKGLYTTYWTVPPEQHAAKWDYKTWENMSQTERTAYNAAYRNATVSASSFDRDDPDLVAAVEALGAMANDRYANLKVVEIPDDVEWFIEEYDGLEWIAEAHETWS
jgi:hypothetical protein